MTRFRTLRPWALVATVTLAFLPAAGGLPADPTHPQVLESSPPTGNCTSPISSMTYLQLDADGASFTVSNTTATQAHDALMFSLIVNGQQRLLWVPVGLRPGRSISVSVHFLQPVTAPVIGLCGEIPGGTTECPTPVFDVVVTVPPIS
jgi:hypothetical protein